MFLGLGLPRALQSSTWARSALIGVVGAAAAWFVFQGGGAAPVDPLDAVPRESFFVATADVAELRRSPIYESIFGSRSFAPGKALQLGMLQEACGFDPFTRIERLAVGVPEKEGERDFGIVAKVEVTREELETCKKRLDEKRGSGGGSNVVERGMFIVLDGPETGGNRARIAYGRNNLLIVSNGSWFDTMLDAANGKGLRAANAVEHMNLRRSLTSRDGWHAPTIVATAILPRGLRDRVKNDMGAELGSNDLSNAVMAGVLGVSSIGAAIRAGTKGGRVDIAIELVCDSADACSSVEKLIQKKRLDWSKDIALRMVGFGPLIDTLETSLENGPSPRLRVTANANADALAATIERVIRLRGAGRAAPEPDDEPMPKPTLRPDETLRAPGSADAGVYPPRTPPTEKKDAPRPSEAPSSTARPGASGAAFAPSDGGP